MFEKYSLEKAQEEASLMKEKIGKGEANNYPEAEKLIEAEKRVKRLCQIYQDMPPENIEKGIVNLLKQIKELEMDDPAYKYLRGVLNLEIYYFLERKRRGNSEGKVYLEEAFKNFSELVKAGTDFETITKNNEGKEISFGNLSLSAAYLGDIYNLRYIESGNNRDWENTEAMYHLAIEKEKKKGLANELKTILAVKQLVRNLGNEKLLSCRKATRREDLRWEAADFIVEYDNGKTVNAYYIDVSGRSKEKKSQYHTTKILKISEKMIENILDADFKAVTKEINQKPPRIMAQEIRKIFSVIGMISENFEKTIDLKTYDLPRFRESFWLNTEKIKKLFPFLDEKVIKIIQSDT